MRIVFISKPFVIDILGVAYLSSYLKKAGHEVDIALVEGNEDYKFLQSYHPEMLCYSVTTGMHRFYADLNKNLRSSGDGLVSVFGGPHVTFFPEYAKEPLVNIAVRGEGLETIVDIANSLEKNGYPTDVNNVVIGNRINPLRPILDKDNLLLPDRDLIYKFPKNKSNPIRNIMCSFQCPHNCHYCFNEVYKNMYHCGVQIRPVEKIDEEIEDLLRYETGLIFFQDDIFPMYKSSWLEDFCQMYQKHQIPFHIQTRIEYVNNENIKKLKSVGLHGVTFAIESGSPALRKDMLGRKMEDEVILRGAEILHKYGIRVRTENMIGFPGETWKTAKMTVKLNRKCAPTIAWASLYQPYPGTALGNYCIERGLFDGNLDSISESFFDKYRLKVPNAKKFERLQKLFSVLVRFPKTKLLLPLAIRLPLTRLYTYIYKKTKNWLYKELYHINYIYRL